MLICNGMKLKHDIYINCIKEETTGFASNNSRIIDYQDDIRNLITDYKRCNDDDKFNDIVKYLNQWKFRTCYNETRHLVFFLNNGSLSGGEILHQMFHETTMLNLIGVST